MQNYLIEFSKQYRLNDYILFHWNYFFSFRNFWFIKTSEPSWTYSNLQLFASLTTEHTNDFHCNVWHVTFTLNQTKLVFQMTCHTSLFEEEEKAVHTPSSKPIHQQDMFFSTSIKRGGNENNLAKWNKMLFLSAVYISQFVMVWLNRTAQHSMA